MIMEYCFKYQEGRIGNTVEKKEEPTEEGYIPDSPLSALMLFVVTYTEQMKLAKELNYVAIIKSCCTIRWGHECIL